MKALASLCGLMIAGTAAALTLSGCFNGTVGSVIEHSADDDTPPGDEDTNGDGGAPECMDGESEPCGTDVGECVAGVRHCASSRWGECEGAVAPVAEEGDAGVCDGLDNDCDGSIDESCPCTVGDARPCGESQGECEPGTQSCATGVWGTCEGGVGPADEACDGLDNDCDGSDDEGLAPIAADNVAGRCAANVKVCSGGRYVDAPANYVPASEICNDLDDNCDGGTDEGCDDDGDGYCDMAMTVMGTPAVCPNSPTDTGDDCNDGAADGAGIHPGAAERCNDVDDNCGGGIDEGCDDDGDDYCDAGMVVIGTPAVCPNSAPDTGDDCADGDASVNPGAVELCTDAVDNDCDELLDTDDTEACPEITVTASPDQIEAGHGSSTTLWATITPSDPNGTSPFAWTRTWEAIDASPSASCAVSDVTLSGGGDGSVSSWRSLGLPNVLGKKDCVYTVRVTVNGYASDTVQIKMVNRAPTITSVANADFDGARWVLRAAAGRQASIVVAATDADTEASLTLTLTDSSGILKTCTSPCVTTDTTSPYTTTQGWSQANAPTADTYTLTASVADAFDPSVTTSVEIQVRIDPCVWVRKSGTGTGTGPALTEALAAVQAGLDQAKGSANAHVCVVGNDEFVEDVVVPSSPRSPDLLAGFDANGSPAALRPTLRITSDADGLEFAAGYGGNVRGFTLRNTLTNARAVTIQDASPVLRNCQIQIPGGSGSIGVRVIGATAASAAVAPSIIGGRVETVSAGVLTFAGVTGIKVEKSASVVVSPRIEGNSAITVASCSGTCRAIHYTPGTSVSVAGNGTISAQSSDTAVAIDLEGSDAAGGGAVSGIIEDNDHISASVDASAPAMPLSGVAIRLSRANRLTITRNGWIMGPFGVPALRFGAAIADGSVARTGAVTEGSSSLVTITDNDAIVGGSAHFGTGCPEGPDVHVGILLAGTSGITLAGNGDTNSAMTGISGGGSTPYWDPTTRRLPPTTAGLWLVNTSGASIEANSIRGGTMTSLAGCAAPALQPAAIGYLDGLPPNPLLGTPAPGEKPSQHTILGRNAISCSINPENGGAGSAIPTWCVAADLNAPKPSTGPTFYSNHLAATRGSYLVPLRQRGGAGVHLVNNTLDSDFVPNPGETLDPTIQLFKYALLLEAIASDGIDAYNNIYYVHADPPNDQALYCVRETLATGTSSNVERLETSLFYIEGDNLADASSPVYVRIEDGASAAEYAPSGLSAIAGVGSVSGNFAALPGLSEPLYDWQKGQARLLPGSAAIDHGQVWDADAAGYDIDDQPRPQATGGQYDIGHDEYMP